MAYTRDGAPAVAVQAADPAGDAQRLGGVGEVQARDGGDLQPAGLGPAVAAVAGAVLGWDVAPGQGGELVVQGGLVGLHYQDVGGLLGGDQPVGVLALAVHGIWGSSSELAPPCSPEVAPPMDVICAGADHAA
jgi:hypothetical protein